MAERSKAAPKKPTRPKPNGFTGLAIPPALSRIFDRIFKRRWVFVLAIFIALALIFWGVYWRPIKVYYRELRQVTVARTQLREVRSHNRELRAEIDSLETTAGIQEYARRSLGLVEKGDHTIVVYENGKPISQDGEAVAIEINESPEVVEPFGQWTRFLDRLLLGR